MKKALAIVVPLVLVGYVAMPGNLPQPPSTRLAEVELVSTISRGERIDLDAYLDEGKWTLVEFGAVW